jgi:hypothetical protein
MSHPFAAMLARMGDENPGQDAETKRPLHEAQIAELREIFAERPLPTVGSLVTPRANCYLTGAGEPHLVLETREDAPLDWSGPVCSHVTGRKLDVRVACLSNEGQVYVTFWVESWCLVAYDSEDAVRRAITTSSAT